MPAYSCCAYGCTNNRHHAGTSIKFYSFPFNRKTVFKAWTRAVRHKNFKPSKSSVICSTHFRDTDFVQKDFGVLKNLKHDAVPSIFEKLPEHLKPKPKKRRRTREKDEVPESTVSESYLISDIKNDNEINVVGQDSQKPEHAENPFSMVRKFVDVSKGTDLIKFATQSTQTTEKAIPHSVNQLKEENRLLKQQVERQSTTIHSLKNLLKALRKKNLVAENYEGFLSSRFKEVNLTSSSKGR